MSNEVIKLPNKLPTTLAQAASGLKRATAGVGAHQQEAKIRSLCRKLRIREPTYFTKGEASDIIDKLLGHTS